MAAFELIIYGRFCPITEATVGLRFHDLRHHAITELAGSQASDRTIMSIAGHVSRRMLAHYSHVQIEAKRKALDALAIGGQKVGYDTNSDTKLLETAIPCLQIIERNGGDDGARTRDLCRDSKLEGRNLLESGERMAPFSALRNCWQRLLHPYRTHDLCPANLCPTWIGSAETGRRQRKLESSPHKWSRIT